MIDSIVAAESAQRDVALERALAEVDSLQSRLSEAERHTEQFRLLGVNTESMLKELRERTAINRAAQEEEIARCVHCFTVKVKFSHSKMTADHTVIYYVFVKLASIIFKKKCFVLTLTTHI